MRCLDLFRCFFCDLALALVMVTIIRTPEMDHNVCFGNLVPFMQFVISYLVRKQTFQRSESHFIRDHYISIR